MRRVDVAALIPVETHIGRVRRRREGVSRTLPGPGSGKLRVANVAIGGDEDADVEALLGREHEHPPGDEGDRIVGVGTPVIQDYETARDDARGSHVAGGAAGDRADARYLPHAPSHDRLARHGGGGQDSCQPQHEAQRARVGPSDEGRAAIGSAPSACAVNGLSF